MNPAELTSRMIAQKARGERIASLTAYDYPTARLLDEAGLDLLLVGDSLGMMVFGFPDTTQVTLAMVEHHTRAVRRGVTRALVAADLPAHTYDTPDQALRSARALVDAGADLVKLEGGTPAECAAIRAIVGDGIPLCAHLGMLPQHVLEEGGYHRKGKTPADAERLEREALAIESAGASMVVLEIVEKSVASHLASLLRIPTIGIGSGTGCDGQILVTHDLTGAYPWFRPPFAKARGDVAGEMQKAARAYLAEVRGGG
jgi:3-methyl-2-oxobutanoate hydroxymethyltransferase